MNYCILKRASYVYMLKKKLKKTQKELAQVKEIVTLAEKKLVDSDKELALSRNKLATLRSDKPVHHRGSAQK